MIGVSGERAMIPHPFLRLGVRSLAWTTICLAIAVVGLTLILVETVPASVRSHVADLLGAPSPDAAASVLAAWDADVYRSFAFLLGFDFLYDVVHNNAVATFVVWGAKRGGARWALLVASLTAWVMWADTALNVFENLVFLDVVRSGEPSRWLPAAAAIFDFRTLTFGLGLLVGLVLHVFAFRRPSRSGTRSE